MTTRKIPNPEMAVVDRPPLRLAVLKNSDDPIFNRAFEVKVLAVVKVIRISLPNETGPVGKRVLYSISDDVGKPGTKQLLFLASITSGMLVLHYVTDGKALWAAYDSPALSQYAASKNIRGSLMVNEIVYRVVDGTATDCWNLNEFTLSLINKALERYARSL